MRKFLLFISIITLLLSGCSRTVHGIQQDSSNAWNGAKGAIHDATAP